MDFGKLVQIITNCGHMCLRQPLNIICIMSKRQLFQLYCRVRRLVILYVHTAFCPPSSSVQRRSCCFLCLIEETCLNVWQAHTFRDEMPNRCSRLQLPLSYSIYLCFPYIYPFKVEMMPRNRQSNSWIHSATCQWLHSTQISLNSSWLISWLQFRSLKLSLNILRALLNSSLLKLSRMK